MCESRQYIELKLCEGIVCENWTQDKYLISGLWAPQHELFLIEEIDEVAEGVDTSAADDHDDYAWFGVC